MSLVLLAEFQEPSQAIVLASALEAAGIPACVPERHIHTYWPYLSLGFTGARVLVASQDVDNARLVAGMDLERPPVLSCPECGGPARRLKSRGGFAAVGLLGVLSWLIGSWAFFIPSQRMPWGICERHRHRFFIAHGGPMTVAEMGYGDDEAKPPPKGLAHG